MKKLYRLGGIVFLAWVMFSACAFAATSFKNVIVFGDSLSDNGNMYALTNGAEPASSHAYQGRWSDGPVWVEYLANYLGAGLFDFAQGGAETGTQSSPPIGLRKQVSDFLSLASLYPTLISDQSLFVVWAGANNFLHGETDYRNAVSDIEIAVSKLADAGAKHILVANLPNLGATPMMNPYPKLAYPAELLTKAFNAALKQSLDNFKQNYPSVSVYYFDTYQLLEQTIANPADYGFTNVTDPYVNEDDTVNDDGEVYLFWDSVHPTTRAHKLLAIKAAELVDATPLAWYDASSGELYIPQVFISGIDVKYVVMKLINIPSDPNNIYFQLESAKVN